MAGPVLQDDQDEKLNQGQLDYEQKTGGDNAYVSAGLDQLEAFANDPENNKSESVKEGEDTPGGWDDKVTGSGPQQVAGSRVKVLLSGLKKRKGLLGFLGAFGITGGLLAGFFGPGSLLINLMENFTFANDSTSTSMERRFMKVFGNMSTVDPICADSTKKMKCKMGRISNSALKKLSGKGVVAYFPDGSSYDGKRLGYPKVSPAGYSFPDGKGGVKNVAMKDLRGFLAQKENRAMAAKLLGTGGAFNLRVKAWIGKYITSKFYKKIGITRGGGIADGKNVDTIEEGEGGGSNKKSRYNRAMEKLNARLPGLEALNTATSRISEKTKGKVRKAGKGGTAYTLAVASCIAVKAPGYVAAGVAAVQLAQIMPIIMDLVLSPGSKAKAAGTLEGSASFTPEDMDTAATVLTEQTPRKSDGKMTSALDSVYLLAALGVNKGKPPVSTAFTPGYSILTNPLIRKSQQLDKKSEDSCNVLMSPAAMYSAAAVDAATTIALAPTVIGAVIKIAAAVVVTVVATEVVGNIAVDIAESAIKNISENDLIKKARGEEVGDILGISAAAFFSAGGMSRHLSVLTESQLGSFDLLRNENETFKKEMDIASLSPLDTSSQYTFLGSIVHNLGTAMIANGTYNNSFSSLFSNIANLSFFALSPTVGAGTNYSTNYCGYAEAFGLTTPDPGMTPAINMSGLPCMGITEEQANMSTEEAITYMESSGWFNEDVEVADNATIDDLIASGYIVGDTPLTDHIESCSNAIEGDYIFNSAGCVTEGTGIVNNPQGVPTICGEGVDEEGATVPICADKVIDDTNDDGIGQEVTSQAPPQPGAIEAINVFLLDYQIVQSINGEDDEESGSSEVAFWSNTESLTQEGFTSETDSILKDYLYSTLSSIQSFYSSIQIEVRENIIGFGDITSRFFAASERLFHYSSRFENEVSRG